MDNDAWIRIALGHDTGDLLWEWFHENSKTSRYDSLPRNDAVVAEMRSRTESLDYGSYPLIELPPTRAPLIRSLEEAIVERETARRMEPCPVTLEQAATLLYYAYGVTRDNESTDFPRPFRTIPSGGALYPLEVYLHTAHVPEIRPGLYHYSAAAHRLRLLRQGDLTDDVASVLVQPEIAQHASIMFFVTALFDRTIFKYRDRGYRFIFLEAGHLAQNLNLTAVAMKLGITNVGGYFDREVDRFLQIDGVTHSTIYMAAIGRRL